MFKWNVFTQILIYYTLATFFIYYLSDYFIFPIPKSSYQDKTLNTIKIKTSDGQMISAVYLKNPKAQYTVLFSHGNGEDLGQLYPYLEAYRDHGFSIFAYDYHGYGTSSGKPSETNTYLDILAAYRYLTDTLKIPAQNIILHGRSLGGGPSLELATQQPIGKIILESAFVSAFQVMSVIPILPVDKYRNNIKIARIHVPILIIHGTKDEVIAFWHGKRLYETANSPKIFFPIEGARHNDVPETAGTYYWNTLQKFAESN